METIAGLVLSACVVVSEVSVPAKVQHGAAEVAEVEMLVEVEGYTSMGTVLSVCAVVSEVSAPANAQLGIVMLETEQEVVVVGSVGDVHVGMSSEMVTVAEGASVNMATSAVLAVRWTEQKTGLCAAFNVKVVRQDMNTTRGVSSNLGVGTRVHLPFCVGMGTGMELAVRADMGMGMNVFGVAGGLRAACSWGQT